MNYYIADLHLDHANCIAFDHRPFADIDDMNNTLIRNWNGVVTAEDTVYVLGDFVWAKEDQWAEWLQKLTGNKVLIRGNHDPKEFSRQTRKYFRDIRDYMEITDSGKHVILCHYPMPFHRADYDEKCYMLYGHVHASREYAMLKTIRKDIRKVCVTRHHARGQFINVGCMMPWMEYAPRTLEQIIKGDSMTEAYEESAQACREEPMLFLFGRKKEKNADG